MHGQQNVKKKKASWNILATAVGRSTGEIVILCKTIGVTLKLVCVPIKKWMCPAVVCCRVSSNIEIQWNDVH